MNTWTVLPDLRSLCPHCQEVKVGPRNFRDIAVSTGEFSVPTMSFKPPPWEPGSHSDGLSEERGVTLGIKDQRNPWILPEGLSYGEAAGTKQKLH